METVHFAELNGARLAYEESGAGDSVVLVHGLGLDRRMWDDQIPELEGHFRVIRYDMRGFGQSDHPGSEPYTAAGDLKGLLEQLQVERAIVIGLSLGGSVALDFAVEYPEMTRALVLIDATVSGWAWSAEWSNETGPIWDVGREKGAQAAREAWLAHPLFVPALEQSSVAARLRTMVTEYSGYHFVHSDPQTPVHPPALERLEEIRCPSLVIVGERDVQDFRSVANTLAARIPQAEMVVIQGAGHMTNMEAPQQVNEAVKRFLSKTLST